MKRRYQLKRRAERQDETRQRIVEAAIALHETIGPAATTVGEIAERAGVGRVTVYRHFPDEATLARACSGLYLERHPAPDARSWDAVEDPVERLRAALRDAYAYHRSTEQMMTRILRDAWENPVMTAYHRQWRDAARSLARAFGVRGRRRTLLEAGIAVALVFPTWRTLVREHGLTDGQAVELMLRLAASS